MKILFSVLLMLIIYSCSSKYDQSLEEKLRIVISQKIDSLNVLLTELEMMKHKDSAIVSFTNNRKLYKGIEPFIEYYFQGLSRRINGPALAEIKTDDNVVVEATGFQVIEELIYSSDSINFDELARQVRLLKTDLKFAQKNFNDLPILNHHLYELLQHQIIRIATLGITGFDSPVAFNSIEEANYAIEAIKEYYITFCKFNKKKSNANLSELLQSATFYLKQNSEFSSFNRLAFIKDHLMPISLLLEEDFKSIIANTPNFEKNKVFYGHLADLMQGKKLNPDAYSPYAETRSTPEKIALGKLLFNEVALSRSNKMSCATCHNADKAFSDGKKTSIGNIHNNTAQRNAPSLLYSSFQKSFFYDLRSQDLENQIERVMQNPDEFDLSPSEIHNKISLKKNLIDLFVSAFPKKSEITPYEIRNAIAAYVRSLMPFKSKMDKYFSGGTTLSDSEINGFNLFAGKAKCATCHFIPLYNGTVPPWYNTSESEVIGVPKSIEWKNAVIDSDEGRYKFNQIEQLRFSFKTPTIRNSESTAPYMHNGVYNSLDEVIKFYELGGGNGIGMNLEYQTLPFDKLDLNENEKKDIISFIKTLTDQYEDQ